MRASGSTNALAARRFCGQSRGTVASFALMAMCHAPRFKPIAPVVRASTQEFGGTHENQSSNCRHRVALPRPEHLRLLEHERFRNAAQMLLQKQQLEDAVW